MNSSTIKLSITFLIVGIIIGALSAINSCKPEVKTETKVKIDTVYATDTVKHIIGSEPDTIEVYETDTVKVTENRQKILDSLRNLNLPLTVYKDTMTLDNGLKLFTRSQIRGYREGFEVGYTNVPTRVKTVTTERTVKRGRASSVNLWLGAGAKFSAGPRPRLQPQFGVGLNVNRLAVFYDYAPFSPVQHSLTFKRRIPIW